MTLVINGLEMMMMLMVSQRLLRLGIDDDYGAPMGLCGYGIGDDVDIGDYGVPMTVTVKGLKMVVVPQ